MILSFTEQNYLKVIYKLSGDAQIEVSTNAVAELTLTKAASVSDMLKKLSEKELVDYQKYQGVRLTELGQIEALKVIRKHRLWEVFLVNKLNFNWDEVHEIAEQLEHIESEVLVEKLNNYLGNPKVDPHGDPIPDSRGIMPEINYKNLSNIAINVPVRMMGVLLHSTTFLQYLTRIGLNLGVEIEVIEQNEFDQSLSLRLNNSKIIFVSAEVSKNLLVANI